jgi:hypothetical protein
MHPVARFIVALGIVLAAGTARAACSKCEPIRNVDNARVVATAGKSLSADQVRESIVRAGAALGWHITDAGPGMLSGTLVLRTHTAVIDIPYSTTSFSLVYKSSVNLDAADGQIHRNYNKWIQYLAKGVDTQTLLF